MKIKKAQTIEEIYQAFETHQPLDRENENLYVDIYNKDLTNLRKDLVLNSIPDKSFFVTGQSGNGKTTALNFLPDVRIEKKYNVKYLKGRDVFHPDDIDIIDVILMIGYTIVKGNSELEKKFLSELEALKNLKLGRLQKQVEKSDAAAAQSGGKTELKGKLSLFGLLDFNSGFFAKFKLEKATRQTVREIFTLDKLELAQKVNGILAEYKAQNALGKNILLIIDDLEKIRKQDQTHELFIENSDVLHKINCVKIVTFPVYLATQYAMYQSASKFSIRIGENPYSLKASGSVECNLSKLEEVIYSRVENKELIETTAAQLAVKFSGGNLRFLVDIIQRASRNAISLDEEEPSDTRLTQTDIQSAVNELAELPSLSVMKRVKVLKYVLDNYKEPEDETMRKDFIDSVLDNSVFAYFNGHPWYEVNPVIKDSVSVYSTKTQSILS